MARLRFDTRTLAAASAAVALLALARLAPVGAWLRDAESGIRAMGSAGVLLYGAFYAAALLVFVPGTLLAIGAGFLFGVGRGAVVILSASTVSAALAFTLARRFARAPVERLARRDHRLAAIDRAIVREGWKVVVLLRLSPLFPFGFSSYLYGLTRMRLAPFLIASGLALLPRALLAVSLGAAAASLDRGRARGPWEWALLAAGIAATLAATLLLARRSAEDLEKDPDAAAFRESGRPPREGRGAPARQRSEA
jgi:uncharacterized membrane protein YdjX (TVP38/TMEM64 family)